jgi:hypothetical protein
MIPVRFILSELVIKTYCDLPGMFFGVRIRLQMRLRWSSLTSDQV